MSIFVDGFRDRIKELCSEDVLENIVNALSDYSEGFEIAPVIGFGNDEGYKLPQAYELYISAMKQNGRMSKGTERQYRLCLERMLNEIRLPLNRITTNHLRLHIDSISTNKLTGEPLSRASLNQRKSIIRSFFQFCLEEEFIDKNPSLRIKRAKDDSKPRQALTGIEEEKVRECTVKVAKRVEQRRRRVRAEIDLLASSGIRVSELCSLNIKDLDFEKREFMVFGKGSKWRKCYMDSRAVVSIRNYLDSRSDDNEALFVSAISPHNRIKSFAVQKDLRECAKESGVEGVSPHKYRHTVATRAINRGMDVATLQKFLGHSEIGTTMRYAHVSDDKVKNDFDTYLQ